MLKQSGKEFARFIIVGTLYTLFGYSVIWAEYNLLHFSYWIASSTAYIGLMPVNYMLHKRITFKKREKGTLKEAVTFVVNILVCYLLAYKIAVVVVDYVLRNIFAIKSQEVIENVALFAGIVFFSLLNFLGQKIVVFKKRNWD